MGTSAGCRLQRHDGIEFLDFLRRICLSGSISADLRGGYLPWLAIREAEDANGSGACDYPRVSAVWHHAWAVECRNHGFCNEHWHVCSARAYRHDLGQYITTYDQKWYRILSAVCTGDGVIQ